MTRLPAKMKALIANAVEAASADMSMKAIDRYSKDYQALQAQGVKFYATPNSVLQAQLKIWDEIVARKEKENPMFKKVNDSMKAFAQRATRRGVEPVVRHGPTLPVGVAAIDVLVVTHEAQAPIERDGGVVALGHL